MVHSSHVTGDIVLRTCAEGDGVDERAGDLLGCSLVPQREVISIKHTLLVLRCQEVSEDAQRMK